MIEFKNLKLQKLKQNFEFRAIFYEALKPRDTSYCHDCLQSMLYMLGSGYFKTWNVKYSCKKFHKSTQKTAKCYFRNKTESEQFLIADVMWFTSDGHTFRLGFV